MKFTFADLFSGAGGFHVALSNAGGKCLYACEIDEHAVMTYQENFGIKPFPDVTTLKPKELPYVDVITFGFPCQDLSSIGTRKGLVEGTRSSLVYDALDIVKAKKPKAFIAENVKGLLSHNKGQTLAELIEFMESVTGYKVFTQLLNSRHFGIPQNRERIYLVGIRKDLAKAEFIFPEATAKTTSLKGYLEKNPNKKYNLSDRLLKSYIYKLDDGKPHKVTEKSAYTRTLNTTYHKIQRLTGTFVDLDGYKLRKLTPREFFNLQGFPKDFKYTVSDTQAYRQAGNAITVTVAEAVMKCLVKYLDKCEKLKASKSSVARTAKQLELGI